jgi:hypothetical protein
MGKYNYVFDSQDASLETLSSEEAVAAIAVVSALSNSDELDVDIDTLVNVLWELEVFDKYSEDDMSEMVDRLLDIAEQEGLGVLFNTTCDFLSDELAPHAFAAGVMMAVDDYGVIPSERRDFIDELKQALYLENKQAQQIIDNVLRAFNEDLESADLDVPQGSSIR